MPDEFKISNLMIALLVAAILVVGFNQMMIMQVYAAISLGGSGVKDYSNVDFSALKSTGHSLAALFPVEDIHTTQDAVDIMLPTGTPEYADIFENKISFDDPVGSLGYLAQDAYPKLKNYVKNNDPDTWNRYINLASQPVGITCEFCCSIGTVGINSKGDLMCGCQHIPALHAITLGLMEYSDYSDAQILHEVLRWKTLFFPKDMINLAMTVAGGDTSSLDELPGMVGGC